MKVAGIDVHKKVLMVVVVDASRPEEKPARRRFVTMPSELHRLLTWLREQGVEEVVMESTAQAVSMDGTRAPHAIALGAGLF
jgi:transposase